MALIKCEKCGQMISDRATICTKCGCPVGKKTKEATPSVQQSSEIRQSHISSPSPRIAPQPKPKQRIQVVESSSNTKTIIIVVCVVLLLICGGVGGWFYYNNFYLPKKIDKEAPRYFTFGNVMLRSSKIAGVDYNKIAMLPYGTRLITYSHGEEWSKIKVESDDLEALNQEGYVASPYILDEKDFFLLNSIFADIDSREAIPTSKCKLALLWYYKDHGYIGNLSVDVMDKLGLDITPNDENQWQVFAQNVENAPNEVFYKKLVHPDSKYNDFAVIIKNIKTEQRKILYFYFDDDEGYHFLTEKPAPMEGEIKNIVLYGYDDIYVTYT